MRSRWICTAVAVVMVALAGPAWAYPPSTPYLPTGGNIAGMLDRTRDFGATQASVGVKTPKPDGSGVQVNMTWSTGVPGVNETFTRYVLSQQFPGDTGDGDGGDLEAFDGVAWQFVSDTPILVKPYSQTYNGFTFYEGTQNLGSGAGMISVPANTPTTVAIDWDEVSGGSIPPANRGNMFEVGFQIFGPSPPTGSTVQSTISVMTLVPEPGLAGLAGVGALALLRRGRRGSGR